MINVAVCDDNQAFLESIFLYIDHLLVELVNAHQIYTYHSSSDLWMQIKNNPQFFHMIILDISMPNIDGIEIARRIRELNQTVLIIFLSGQEHYVYDTFRYNPFRFIPKSDVQQKMLSCIKEGIEKIKQEQKSYIFKTEEGVVKLQVGEITYLELVNRHIELHTFNKTHITMYRCIKEIEELFVKEDFVKLHRGCIVNMKFIRLIEGQKVVLDSGEQLIASRYRKAEILQAFRQFIR